jgi:TusA-related sulfurtransferase
MPDYFLDITADVCPMTFVRTKLLVEKVPPGAMIEIRLQGREPIENVPRSLAELGHEIVSLAPESEGGAVHRLRIRKKEG